METEKQLTFEEVNAHIEEHLTAQKLQAFTVNAPELCTIYKAVRPILVLASQAFFIPQSWRNGIKVLIGVLDTLCP